jgi:hypothetical protein
LGKIKKMSIVETKNKIQEQNSECEEKLLDLEARYQENMRKMSSSKYDLGLSIEVDQQKQQEIDELKAELDELQINYSEKVLQTAVEIKQLQDHYEEAVQEARAVQQAENIFYADSLKQHEGLMDETNLSNDELARQHAQTLQKMEDEHNVELLKLAKDIYTKQTTIMNQKLQEQKDVHEFVKNAEAKKTDMNTELITMQIIILQKEISDKKSELNENRAKTQELQEKVNKYLTDKIVLQNKNSHILEQHQRTTDQLNRRIKEASVLTANMQTCSENTNLIESLKSKITHIEQYNTLVNQELHASQLRQTEINSENLKCRSDLEGVVTSMEVMKDSNIQQTNHNRYLELVSSMSQELEKLGQDLTQTRESNKSQISTLKLISESYRNNHNQVKDATFENNMVNAINAVSTTAESIAAVHLAVVDLQATVSAVVE